MSAVAQWEAPLARTVRSRRHLTLVHSVPRQRADVGHADGVRLTVRGRRIVAALLLALVAVGGWGVGKAVAGAPSVTDVVVGPGQTLSEIAHAAYPKLPVGEAVVRVQLANDLNSLQVSAGQHLVVPR